MHVSVALLFLLCYTKEKKTWNAEKVLELLRLEETVSDLEWESEDSDTLETTINGIQDHITHSDENKNENVCNEVNTVVEESIERVVDNQMGIETVWKNLWNWKHSKWKVQVEHKRQQEVKDKRGVEEAQQEEEAHKEKHKEQKEEQLVERKHE